MMNDLEWRPWRDIQNAELDMLHVEKDDLVEAMHGILIFTALLG